MSDAHRPHRRPRRVALVATVLLASVCTGTFNAIVTPGVASAGTGPSGLGYVAVTPCRAVSTTSGAPVAPGTARTFRIAGSGPEFASQGGAAGGCGIPDNVPAVVVSITAVDPSGNGFLRVFPAGTTEPIATFINYTAGTGITNTGAVKLSTTGTLDLAVLTHGAATDLVVDVQGYFTSSGRVSYRAITPCRVLNTAATASPPFGPNESREIQVAGTGANFATQGGNSGGCGVPDGASAVEVSITAVAPLGAGFIRMAKAGTADAALKSTLLNYTDAQNITNTATIDLAALGTLDLKIRNFGSTADVVIDVQGYFAPSNTARFVPVTPCRVLSTIARDARLPANGARGVRITGGFAGLAPQGVPGTSGGCAIDDDATAVVASVTAVNPTGDGFVRSWPTGVTPPTATMLNYADARPITNTGALALAGSGAMDLVVRNFGGSTDLVIDVQGYFADADNRTPINSVATTFQSSCVQRNVANDPLFAGPGVRCWGDGTLGQLGNNATVDSPSPVSVQTVIGGSIVADFQTAQQVDGGVFHMCAVTGARTVLCWGSNVSGELGFITSPENKALLPRFTAAGLTGAMQVDAGSDSTCATLAAGGIRCWGSNRAGQLGTGTTADSTTPVAVLGIDDAVQVTTNGNPLIPSNPHSCALRANGTVRCWGGNANGQLGNGTTAGSLVPVDVSGLVGVTQVAAGESSTCALVRGGQVKCWGRGASGQLGNGSTTQRTTPVDVDLDTPAIKIDVGSSSACALLIDGRVACWGDGAFGRLGNGSLSVTSTPTSVTTLTSLPSIGGVPPRSIVQELRNNTDLSISFNHGCTSAGSSGLVRCWGFNTSGQVGDGTSNAALRAIRVQGAP